MKLSFQIILANKTGYLKSIIRSISVEKIHLYIGFYMNSKLNLPTSYMHLKNEV